MVMTIIASGSAVDTRTEPGEQGDRPLPRDQGEEVSQAGVEYTGDHQARAASQGSPLQMPLLFSPPLGADGNYREASAQEITVQLLRVQIESLKQYLQTMEAQLAHLESQLSPQRNESSDVGHSSSTPMQAGSTGNDPLPVSSLPKRKRM